MPSKKSPVKPNKDAEAKNPTQSKHVRVNSNKKPNTKANNDFPKAKVASKIPQSRNKEESHTKDEYIPPINDVILRLSLHQKTKLDIIKDSVPKPKGYLPPRYLPTWETMMLEQRLPLLPAPPGALYFTRGALGKKLLRENVIYSTGDPLNVERIPSNKYEDLHAPENRLVTNVHAKENLTQSRAVNEKGEVICTQKEFNRYRKYLATLYNDQVREKLRRMDELKALEREQDREFRRQESMRRGLGKQAIRYERVAKAKEFIRQRGLEKWERYVKQENKNQKRLLQLEQEKGRYRAYMTKISEDQKRLQEKRVKDTGINDFERKKRVLHQVVLKGMRAAANKNHVDNNRKLINAQKQADWFDAKLVSAAERLEHEKEIQTNCSENMKRQAIKRQKRVENFRKGLPKRNAERKVAQEKLNQIVRKFAMRWLNRVRERLRKRTDEEHESIWFAPKKNCLEEGLDYLYNKSGKERLDDVVLNILKFKEQLKKQILLDEDDDELDDDEDDEDEDEGFDND